MFVKISENYVITCKPVFLSLELLHDSTTHGIAQRLGMDLPEDLHNLLGIVCNPELLANYVRDMLVRVPLSGRSSRVNRRASLTLYEGS